MLLNLKNVNSNYLLRKKITKLALIFFLVNLNSSMKAIKER